MGNHSETSTVMENQEFSLEHPKINNAVFKKTKDHEYFETTYPIEDNKQYDSWKDNLKENPAADSQWAMYPVKHQYKKAGMCGSSGTATARYDNYPFILNQQIQNKQTQEQNKKFADYQIWYLLYVLTDTAHRFHEKGQKVGDIRPNNVFINEDGKIKVATKHSWPKEISSYEKLFFDKEKAYLSPEEMKQVEIGKAKSHANPTLAEVFSIGLTTLDAILLQNSQHLYQNQTFDRSRLAGKRQNLKNQPGYSDLLKYTVLNMTDPNPENRVRTSTLYNWFQPFKNKVINLQPFGVNDIPDKIRETIDANPLVNRGMQQSQTKPIMVQQNPIISSQEPNKIYQVESGYSTHIQNNEVSVVSPINRFTAENSQVRQQPVIVQSEKKEDVVVRHQVRQSLDQINQRIANSQKNFPS